MYENVTTHGKRDHLPHIFELRLLSQYTVNYNTQRFFWCSYFFDFSDMYSTTNGFIHLAHQLQFRENRC